MKLFGDEKTKKKTVKAAFAIIVCSIAAIMVVLALQLKPFSADLGARSGRDGEDDPLGTSVDDSELGQPEVKDISLADLAKFDEDRKQDYYTILIGGTDEDGTRTDTIMVISFDTKSKAVSLLSVPRDTLVNVTRSVKKINSGYAVGGVKELKKELKTVLGFDIDRYAIVNFDAVEQMVDAFGGVYFEVPKDIEYKDPTQDLHIDLKAGYQKLSGEQFVHYARYRKGYLNGDIGRISAQQDLLASFAKQLICPSTIPKIPRLVSILTQNVESDFSVGELISLAVAGLSVDAETIEMFTLPGYDDTIKGQSYWIPYGNQVLKLVNSNFNPNSKQITSLNLLDPDTLRPQEAEEPAENSGEPSENSGEPLQTEPDEQNSGDDPAFPPGLFTGGDDEDPITLD